MAEKVADVFVDGMTIIVSAYGCTVRFLQSISEDPSALAGQAEAAPEAAPMPSAHVVTIRMTPEFLKGVVFVMHQHVRDYEQSVGGKIPIPADLVDGARQGAAGATQEQWDEFWK
jgi:hypothetical protein